MSGRDHDRPSSRLLQRGAQVLSDIELLAALLGDDSELASGLLDETNGLAELFSTGVGGLDHLSLEPTHSTLIMAVREIAARLWHASLEGREVLERPGTIANYLLIRYGIADQEVFGALFVDIRQRLLGEQEIFRGALTKTTVEPRQILKAALRYNASGVVLFHTHPSGDPAPSADDYEFTGRMRDACKIVGIELVDHLIVGHLGRWVSLKSRGGF